jgi:glycosidase
MRIPAALRACLVLVVIRPAAAWTQAPDTSWVARSALYEVNIRDFSQTGDLKGVIAGLDRIQASGANVIWLMPVHPVGVLNRKGTLGSPYAARDYYAIDSAFGMPQDFQALVQAAHARGLKLILDWVPDHTAWDHVWITQHPEYYARNEKGEITVPRDLQGRLTDWTDVAQLDYHNPALRQAIIAAMRHWLVDFDLDGFRVDVAGFVPDAFWREAIPALRSSVPRRILLLAEWGDLNMHRSSAIARKALYPIAIALLMVGCGVLWQPGGVGPAASPDQSLPCPPFAVCAIVMSHAMVQPP